MKSLNIYGLVDPETLQVRYVGRTIQNLNKRLQQHYYSKHKTYTVSWITSLKKKYLKPIIVLLDSAFNEQEHYDLERWWISYRKSVGLGFN